MTSRELEIYAGRIARAVETIGYSRLLTLPKQITKPLQETNDVVLKTRMLEKIAYDVRRGAL